LTAEAFVRVVHSKRNQRPQGLPCLAGLRPCLVRSLLAENLSQAITQLGATVDGDLSAIIGFAQMEGQIGDYFRTQMSVDEAKGILDSVSAAVSGIAFDPTAAPGLQDVTQTLGIDATGQTIGAILDLIAASTNGLGAMGNAVYDQCVSSQQQLDALKQCLLAGAPAANEPQVSAYINDLQLRGQADTALLAIVQQQEALETVLRGASIASQNDWENQALEVASFAGVALDGLALTGFLAPVAIAYNIGLGAVETYEDLSSFNVNQQAYFKTFASLANAWNIAEQISTNTEIAYSEISRGVVPNPVLGQVNNVASTSLAYELTTTSGWLGFAGIGEEVTNYVVTNAFTTLTVQNTGGSPATFVVFALFDYASNFFGVKTNAPMVVSNSLVLGGGQSGHVRLQYFDGNKGAVPDVGSSVTIYILGQNSNGIFLVASLSSSPELVVNGSDPSPNSSIFENPL
jgi:hypothetical protein